MQFEAHKDLFLEEADDLLREMESPLMELEKEPDNHELIDSVFRAMHTIKGSSAMFGFTDITDFTHEIESTFDLVRKGRLKISPELIELTLAAKDALKELLYANNSAEETEKRRMILSRYSEISGISPEKDSSLQSATQSATDTPDQKSESAAESAEPESDSAKKAYHIEFEPDREILLRGVRISPLLDDIHSLGQFMVKASVDAIPPIQELNPEHCYLKWDIDLATGHTEKDIKNCFIFVEDYAKIKIEHIPGFDPEVNTPAGAGTSSAPSTQTPSRPAGSGFIERRHSDTSSIRVKNEKLDSLVNLVGEMVTLHARLGQESTQAQLPEFIAISENLGRLTTDLREIAMSVRMVPLAETFSSFNRLVHDLAKTLGKKIVITAEGGETELDKNVIEELRDPLMHIIRNSADHGIESPDVRRKKNKNETGTIALKAEHSGANVRISITDDGNGLDRDAIVAKALQTGLIASPEIDDHTAYSLIFEPGFSTSANATDISGRGVGMDVVKKNVDKLRGTIDIRTEKGNGTTFSISIPLTLAIIDGFMIESGAMKYVFNLSLVRECMEFNDSLRQDDDQGMFRLRDHYIPFVDIRTLFDISANRSSYPQIVVAEVEGTEIGFLVDRVIGHCQIVIKPLGKGIRNAEMFSGATILGDGSIALIIDVNQIMKKIATSGLIKHTAGN